MLATPSAREQRKGKSWGGLGRADFGGGLGFVGLGSPVGEGWVDLLPFYFFVNFFSAILIFVFI